MEWGSLHYARSGTRSFVHLFQNGQTPGFDRGHCPLRQGKLEEIAVSTVRVPSGLYFQSRFFAATRKIWKRLGDLESMVVRQEAGQRVVDRPVYIAGLPRSGTTILTEMLEKHPDLTCHRYSDFPNVWTPYWRNYLRERTRVQMHENGREGSQRPNRGEQ